MAVHKRRKRKTPSSEDGANPVVPIVGIGSSAGGLTALEAFFAAIPAETDPGIAFVLVQHLPSEPRSLLPELLQHHTRLPIREIKERLQAQANSIYVLPPQQYLSLENGWLQPTDPTDPPGHRYPIDHFFRSLAHDQGARSIGIVLSGNGTDGVEGARAIKAKGGMVMVQSLSTCHYDSMPQSVLATGLVDFALSPIQMPAQLLSCLTGSEANEPLVTKSDPAALDQILLKLRTATGHEFSQYKSSTLLRRIERRLAVHHLHDLGAYVQVLEQQPEEVNLLFRDLLIGVTAFFRDPEAFRALQQEVIPQLFIDKPPGSAVRCWSAGCSTGEEAYSLAILLREQMDLMHRNFRVQIFATDIDPHAIAVARAGQYPLSIASDLSQERLARHFTLDASGRSYQINRSIREMLVFSEHDLILDPPFSRLDLISCRNVMIYMGGELQKKLFPLFHYALRTDGILFLGTSETVGENQDFFRVLDRKARLFRRIEAPQYRPALGSNRLAATRLKPESPGPPVTSLTRSESPRTWRQLTEKTLLEISLPAALINAQGDLLYLHGRSADYLEPAPGDADHPNVLKMARESLRGELMAALREATASQQPYFRTLSGPPLVQIGIWPIEQESGAWLYLVRFEDARRYQEASENEPQEAVALVSDPDVERRIRALKNELRIKEEFLELTNEELENANRELRSANEEMQSVNEELQSSNEELETSKEELQSVNEELTTVNIELQSKVSFLSSSQNDLNNLLAGTGIATVFVDPQLRVLRFTPAATAIVNLIPGDVGRPLEHLVTNLVNHADLSQLAGSVLESLKPQESLVSTRSGSSYRMRILPYRTLENQVEGVVITFMDVTENQRALQELEATRAGLQRALQQHDEARFRQSQLLQVVPLLSWRCDLQGDFHTLSPEWNEFSGLDEAQLTEKGWLQLVHPDDRAVWTEAWTKATSTGVLAARLRLKDRSGQYLRFECKGKAVGDGWVGIHMGTESQE